MEGLKEALQEEVEPKKPVKRPSSKSKEEIPEEDGEDFSFDTAEEVLEKDLPKIPGTYRIFLEELEAALNDLENSTTEEKGYWQEIKEAVLDGGKEVLLVTRAVLEDVYEHPTEYAQEAWEGAKEFAQDAQDFAKEAYEDPLGATKKAAIGTAKAAWERMPLREEGVRWAKGENVTPAQWTMGLLAGFFPIGKTGKEAKALFKGSGGRLGKVLARLEKKGPGTTNMAQEMGQKKATKAAMKDQPWTVREGQEWKNKIYGKAQKTGTEGHSFRSYREAIKAAKKENVESVYLNQGLKKASGHPIKPNNRPDVTVVTKDGKVHQIEVPSKTDDVKKLEKRMDDARAKLPEEMQGENDIRKITKDK